MQRSWHSENMMKMKTNFLNLSKEVSLNSVLSVRSGFRRLMAATICVVLVVSIFVTVVGASINNVNVM